MAFLTLNGQTIKALSGSSNRNDVEIGETERAFSGALRSTRRALKFEGNFKARVAKLSEARDLVAMLLGLGDHWAFTNTESTLKATASDKGLAATSFAGAVPSIVKAADGTIVANESQFGDGAVRVSESVVNISDEIDGEGANFSTTDASDFDNNTFFVIGGGCRQVQFDADLDATRSQAVLELVSSGASQDNTDYVASVYAKGAAGSEGKIVRFRLEEGTNIGANVLHTLTDSWVRVEDIHILTDGASTRVELVVEEDTIDEGASVQIDAIQMEESRLLSSAFTETSSPGNELSFPSGLFAGAVEGVTFNIWTRSPKPLGANRAYIFKVQGADTGNRLQMFQSPSANDLQIETSRSGSALTTGAVIVTPWDSDWHMLTCVFRDNPGVGENEQEIYFDGALAATANPGLLLAPVFSDLAGGTLAIGSNTSVNPWNGPMEDATVLPRPTDASQILAWFNSGSQTPTMPNLKAEGDFLDRAGSIIVRATVGQQSYIESSIEGTFHNNSLEVPFTLKEV